MKKLYFVRHGLSVMNKKGIFSGRTDTPLAPEGHEQARQTGKEAKQLGIDCIVTSPMRRARQTAEIIAAEIGYPPEKIIEHEFFMERGFGPLEGTPYQPQQNLDEVDGVESSLEIIERAKQGVEYLRSLPYDTILVVSHGSTGRALRHVLQPHIPFEHPSRFDNAKLEQLL